MTRKRGFNRADRQEGFEGERRYGRKKEGGGEMPDGETEAQRE